MLKKICSFCSRSRFCPLCRQFIPIYGVRLIFPGTCSCGTVPQSNVNSYSPPPMTAVSSSGSDSTISVAQSNDHASTLTEKWREFPGNGEYVPITPGSHGKCNSTSWASCHRGVSHSIKLVSNIRGRNWSWTIIRYIWWWRRVPERTGIRKISTVRFNGDI